MNSALQATQNPAPAKESLSTALGRLDNQISRAANVRDDLRVIADQLLGGKPRDAGAQASPPAPNSSVGQFHQRAGSLTELLTEIDDEISRIKSAL